MNTRKQIEVFLFKKLEKGTLVFLLLKRTPQRGGFWQPITGGVKKGEDFLDAVGREIREETGISSISAVLDTGYHYEFVDHGQSHVEFVYGAEIDPATRIVLSNEHSQFKWGGKGQVLKLLKWPGNKEGFRKLIDILQTK